MRVPPDQACTRSVQYSFDRSQTPTADPHGWRAALSQGPASERRRPHATSARARVAVPALAAGLLLVHHEDAYQCVRTCPGARGWGEAWAAGAVPVRKFCRISFHTGVQHVSFVGKRRALFHPGMQHVQNPRVCVSTASTRMSKMDKEELSNR